MENEAITKYKFYLCKNFLDRLLCDNLITEQQKKKLENTIIKRLAGV